MELLNRVWTDDAFAARLESDPKAVFVEMGGQIDDDVEIRVVRDTENVKHLYIPAAPSEGAITDALICSAPRAARPSYCIATTTVPGSFILSAVTVCNNRYTRRSDTN